MSPNMKLSFLALVGAATAIPHYGHGHKHSTPSAGYNHAYPTGSWSGYNVTTPSAAGTGSSKPSSSSPAGNGSPYPSSSGPAGNGSPYPSSSGPAGNGNPYSSSSSPAGEETTNLDYTITSTTTRTVYLTVNTNSAAPTSVGIKDVSTSEAACGPATVYVTATNKVTVTVSPSPVSYPSSSSETPEASSVPEVFPSSPAPKPTIPTTPGYKAATSFVPASSSAEAEKPSSTPVSSSTPAPKEAAATTSAYSSSASASSAPASTPSSSPGYSGGKRGLAYRYDGAADCKSFEGKKFGFAWNWEADTKGDIGSFSKDFIPTLRTMDGNAAWPSKVDAAVAGGSKVVFGYNEVDIVSQANLDIDALCKAWKANMNTIAEKYPSLTIVGPSVSSSENPGQGLDYLSKFVSQCSGAVFHDINIHWYGPASAGFDAFKAHYEQAVSKFPGKKVWVTEFGLTNASADESADFLKKAQTYLDGESTCAGYSYFAVGNWDATANLLGTGTALSKTGEVYVS